MDVEALKRRTAEAWSLGDYSKIAPLIEEAARELVDACAMSAGQDVLDVAAGNGNLALLAAAEGARVVASDLTPHMVELGRARSEAEGFDIEWVVGDAEALPFEDESFDCVASVFGAVFAPRPEVVAAELFRVVRPGGTVGLTSWTPEGFQGRAFAIGNRYVPMPEGVPSGTAWGDEGIARERLGGLASSLHCERRTLRWEFESPAELARRLSESGPSQARRERLSDEEAARMLDELVSLVGEFNRAGDGSVKLDAEYVVVVARTRG